ncbi:MAG: serine hydrolase domain-containing protein, partial [Caulobacteraceae bacterium]
MQDRAFHSAWIAGDAPVRGAGEALALFPWWSFTKTVLAVAALRLVEQGRLELDTPRAGKPWTLRQLLTHRAGVPNYGKLAAYHEAVARGEDAWSRDRLLAAVDADRLDFEPGTGWTYSNVGYLFARDAVEEAAGLPLAEALRDLVLEPLGLDKVRLATGRADFADIYWPHLRAYDPRWVYHGCLIGPPADAARLLHAVLNGELLSAASLDDMLGRFTPLGGALPGRPVTEQGYGMGFMIGRMGEAGRVIGHNGAGPGSVNAVCCFPDLPRPATVAVFTEGEDEQLAPGVYEG